MSSREIQKQSTKEYVIEPVEVVPVLPESEINMALEVNEPIYEVEKQLDKEEISRMQHQINQENLAVDEILKEVNQEIPFRQLQPDIEPHQLQLPIEAPQLAPQAEVKPLPPGIIPMSQQPIIISEEWGEFQESVEEEEMDIIIE